MIIILILLNIIMIVNMIMKGSDLFHTTSWCLCTCKTPPSWWWPSAWSSWSWTWSWWRVLTCSTRPVGPSSQPATAIPPLLYSSTSGFDAQREDHEDHEDGDDYDDKYDKCDVEMMRLMKIMRKLMTSFEMAFVIYMMEQVFWDDALDSRDNDDLKGWQ